MVRASPAASSAGYGDLQAEAREWIEAITGEALEGEFADSLRDGVKLCKLLNMIKPNSIKRVNTKEGQNKFKQMENISNFIRGCRNIGVKEYSLFETVDLYEGKDVGLVVKCLHALGGTAQLECPEFRGPHLGLKPMSRVSPKTAKAPPGAATPKAWSRPPSSSVSSSPSSAAPAKSWSTPSSGRPAAPVTSSSSSSASYTGSRGGGTAAVTTTTAGRSAAATPSSPPAPPAAAVEPPPPPFYLSASTISGATDDTAAALPPPPPPPPYNGTATRWGSGEVHSSAMPAAVPPPASAARGRLPPPAYREDISSRFADSVRVAGRSSGSISPRGAGSGGPGRAGAVNGSSQAPRPQSPPRRPQASPGFSQQHTQAAAATVTATATARDRSRSPPYARGVSPSVAATAVAAAPAPAPFGAAAATGHSRQQARATSPVPPGKSTPPAPKASSAPEAVRAPCATVPPPAVAAAEPVTVQAASATSSPHRSSTGRGGGYGLDAELAAKREANYDYDAEAEAQEWIEAATGSAFADEFGEELRDGRRLCELINRIKPGAVRRVNDSRMPFKQMENVSNFLKACRSVGVAEYSLFETVDLYEAKDLGLVVRCLHALGQTVQKSCPEYNGPRLGVMQTETNKREWTAEQQQQQLLNSSGAMSQLMAGSSKTMERGAIIKTGVTFGATQSGTGDPTSAGSGWTMGSANTMGRSHIAKSGPTFGADYAGASGDASGTSSRFTGGRR